MAKFEAFSSRRSLDGYAAESAPQGHPPDARLVGAVGAGAEPRSASGAQAAPQPGYRNIDIARGAQDRYIMRFAREVARFPGTV